MPISNAIIKKVSDATPITDTVNLITTAQGSSPYAISPGTLNLNIYGVIPDIEHKKISFEYFATVFYTANGTEYLAYVDGSTSAEGIDLPDLCAAVGAMPVVTTDSANNSVTVDEFGTITFNIYYAIDYKKCEETLVSVDMGDPILPNDKYMFLKGVVYSPLREPLSGAAINIVQINSNVNPPLEKNIGVTFTLENGYYGVPLLWREGYSYKITAYAPG